MTVNVGPWCFSVCMVAIWLLKRPCTTPLEIRAKDHYNYWRYVSGTPENPSFFGELKLPVIIGPYYIAQLMLDVLNCTLTHPFLMPLIWHHLGAGG